MYFPMYVCFLFMMLPLVLKENLSKKGVLNGIKSQIQSAVFKELDDEVTRGVNTCSDMQ